MENFEEILNLTVMIIKKKERHVKKDLLLIGHTIAFSPRKLFDDMRFIVIGHWTNPETNVKVSVRIRKLKIF